MIKSLPWWHSGKESACQCRRLKRRGFDPWVGKIPQSRKWRPTPVLPGKRHGQRSLEGYSPQAAESWEQLSAHTDSRTASHEVDETHCDIREKRQRPLSDNTSPCGALSQDCLSCLSRIIVRVSASPRLSEKTSQSLSRVQLFATLWTVAYQASPSMGFSRQEYWSGLPFPSPGDLPDPGIEPRSPTLEADALTSEPPGNIGTFEDSSYHPNKVSITKGLQNMLTDDCYRQENRYFIFNLKEMSKHVLRPT